MYWTGRKPPGQADRDGRPVAIGRTSTGRNIIVVYEEIDEDTAYPVTAYDLED